MSTARLRLHAASGKVVVEAQERDDIRIGPDATREEGDDGTIEVRPRRRSGSLHVKVPLGSDVMIGTASGDVELVGALGAVRVTSRSGSIDVGRVESADLRTLSGGVTVEQCAGLCRVSNKSGKVVVGEGGDVEISSVSGSVKIEAHSHVDVRTVSGKVAVQSGAGGPVRVRTVSGSIDVGLPAGTKPNVHIAGRGTIRGDYEDGDDVEVDVKTVSGKIEIAAR